MQTESGTIRQRGRVADKRLQAAAIDMNNVISDTGNVL